MKTTVQDTGRFLKNMKYETNLKKNSVDTARSSRQSMDEEMVQVLLEYRATGRDSLRERLIGQYTNLVESIARRFSGTSEPFEDLVQEGYIGLLNAIDLYDPSKNVKFPTYATHFIVGQIKHHLRDRGKIIKEPAWLQEMNHRMTRVMDALTQQLGTAPSNLQIALSMGISEEEVAELMMNREIFKVTSIDGSVDKEDDSGATIDVERKDVAVSFQVSLDERMVLEAAMSQLKPLEQKVIQEFYFRDLTQTEIARQLDISCNYVSHILRNATRKMKQILSGEEARNRDVSEVALQKREEIAKQSEYSLVVDPLTRLYNRRYFEARLEEEITRTSRSQMEMSLLFIKVDGLRDFARLNGTLKSDEIVRRMATSVKASIRKADILTRYDKDIFALILPFTGSRATIVRERLGLVLCDILEDYMHLRMRSPISCRMGMSIYPMDGTSGNTLILKITKDLYPPEQRKIRVA